MLSIVTKEEEQLPSMNQKTVRIVIQGGAGAFHEIAARRYQYLNNVEIVPAETFQDLIAVAQNPSLSDGGIMAIENSIYGSILPNYALLNGSNLEIIGEVYLRIKQNLMVLPGQKIEDLTEVYSHPVAIVQCKPFFKKYPKIKLIEKEDTALSAKMVRDNNWKHAGAIASSAAANLYEMDIIADGIETNKANYTRFLVLGIKKEIEVDKDFNKVSICFSLQHEVGSLHKVLSVLSATNANLTKIQSAPIIGTAWEYRFFIDYLVESKADFKAGIEAIKVVTSELKILGKYQRGQLHEN